MTATPHAGGPLEELLERSGRFFTPGEFSADLRSVTRRGGRKADVFYRDRWSHDKVVRSTHGVNCTGSCSWKIFVKDGIITWETQQTDYPSVGPDRPEYEPRGCPRGSPGRREIALRAHRGGGLRDSAGRDRSKGASCRAPGKGRAACGSRWAAAVYVDGAAPPSGRSAEWVVACCSGTSRPT